MGGRIHTHHRQYGDTLLHAGIFLISVALILIRTHHL